MKWGAAWLFWFAALAGMPAAAQPLTDLSQAYRALEAGRYSDVEALYARLRQERKRQPDGTFVFERFTWSVYWISSSKPDDLSYWPRVDAATRAWLAHSPQSHVAAMTRAFALAYRAGSVQAREDNWKEADRLAAEARRVLDSSRREGALDPLWHAARLRVASVEALPRTDVLDLVHAAVAVDPTVMRIWVEAAIALSPNGSNTDDMLWLMRLAAQRAGSSEGASMYARVLDATFWHFGNFLGSPFQRNGLDWPELHESFLDWKRRYPAGYPPDLHAALACAARDRETTRSVLSQTGLGTRTNVWELLGGKNYRAICKEWAEGAQKNSPRQVTS